MTIFREDHEQPWQLDHLCLSVRSMFDALRKYAIEVEEQADQEMNNDTIIGMCEAGYDLADRAWHLSMELDRNRDPGASVQSDSASDDPPDPLSAAAVEVAQQFETFDAEQQETIRRVMREFAV